MERLDKDDLKNDYNDFKVTFSARLSESDQVKILQPTVFELSDIIKESIEIIINMLKINCLASYIALQTS